jgi:putative protease
MPELLAPAGNMEKLQAAVLYGADAVYLAGRMFGMRAAADNFSVDELREAVSYAHAHNVRVYLTVNVMPREHEYGLLRDYFAELKNIPIDALIIADVGVLALAKELLPDVAIHISTQANVVSAATCRAYQALGASRIVLARELTLEEIKRIRDAVPDIELEAFIHGSMCVSYSGRCLLSNFLTGRDANRGMCTQPCRWNYQLRGYYEITEEKRPDTPIQIEQINGETFFMSSQDTCMIEHVPALMESGIDSFKIEGRMKSAYYAAVVTNTYRMAMDAYAAGNYVFDFAWKKELESVSHRPYHTGYYFDKATENANTTSFGGYLRENAYLAIVRAYDEKTGVALLQQRNKYTKGDAVELLTPGKTGIPFIAGEMWNEANEPIEAVPHPQMKYYMKMPFAVKAGDILRAAPEKER